MSMDPKIIIKWETADEIPHPAGGLRRFMSRVRGEDPDLVELDGESIWRANRVLYAYLDPDDREILYIGKVWGGDVWSRFHAVDKDRVWTIVDEEYGLVPEDLEVIVGTPSFTSRSRLTKETLAYLEGLLIYHVEPAANTASKSSMLSREGMVIRCEGDWPEKRLTYIDE